MFNKKLLEFIFILFILSTSIMGVTESTIADEIVVESPYIVTSAGQSNCYQLFNSILKQYEVEPERINNLIVAEDLENKNSLVLIIGGNYKNLKMLEMEPEDEMNRMKKLIAEAKSKNIKTVSIYLGQPESFNNLSKSLMRSIFPISDYIIVVNSPEVNELLFDLEKEHKINFTIVDKLIQAGETFINVLEGEEVGVCNI